MMFSAKWQSKLTKGRKSKLVKSTSCLSDAHLRRMSNFPDIHKLGVYFSEFESELVIRCEGVYQLCDKRFMEKAIKGVLNFFKNQCRRTADGASWFEAH